MKSAVSTNSMLVIKLVCAVFVIGFMLCVYPFHIIPIENVRCIPDGSFVWEQLEVLAIKGGTEVRLEYHPSKTLRVQSIAFFVKNKTFDEDKKVSIMVCDSLGNVMGQSQIKVSDIKCNTKQVLPLKTSFLDERNRYFILLRVDNGVDIEFYFVDKAAEKYLVETYINETLCSESLLLELHSIGYPTRDIGIYTWIVGILFIVWLLVPWKKIGYSYLRGIIIIGSSLLFLMMSYYQKIYQTIQGSSILKGLYFVFIVITICILTLHMYINIREFSNKVEKCFVVSVIGWGMLYLLLMPPYSYPDEPTHYAQANAYVNQLMGNEVCDESGQIYIRSEELIDVVSFPSKGSIENYYDKYLTKADKSGYGTMDIVNGKGVSSASTICYFPFEIGIIVARLCGLNYVWSFTISNVLGLICYTLMVYIAIRLMPMGKWILFLTAQFPLALSMATSFTYDIMNYSLLTLFFALFCKMLLSEEQIGMKGIFVFILLGIMAFPIKYAYISFCILIILLPNNKFQYKHANVVKLVIIGVFIIATFRDNMIVSHLANNNILYQDNDFDSDGLDITEFYRVEESNWQSKNEIVSDKSNFIKYTYNTLYKYLDYYWNGMIGMKIGWGDTFIPDYVYNFWWILVLFGIISTESRISSLDKKVRMGIFLICILSVGAIYLAMLLHATPVGYTDCPSVGARYLLPVLFPFCIALRGKKIRISEGISDELYIWGADLCQLVAIIYTFVGYTSR